MPLTRKSAKDRDHYTTPKTTTTTTTTTTPTTPIEPITFVTPPSPTTTTTTVPEFTPPTTTAIRNRKIPKKTIKEA